jgi:hypothetical protein
MCVVTALVLAAALGRGRLSAVPDVSPAAKDSVQTVPTH